MVNEPSVFEPLKVYCSLVEVTFRYQAVRHGPHGGFYNSKIITFTSVIF